MGALVRLDIIAFLGEFLGIVLHERAIELATAHRGVPRMPKIGKLTDCKIRQRSSIDLEGSLYERIIEILRMKIRDYPRDDM